ncbi:hypothetical protein Fcan01_27698 [Folsomia candida]|uniref:Uncharacterized protein n=1 Tax=Folsomia candida TaxID=158441 RepID=A0A226CYA2_FOLCA|nr:hypothetical protein Fcan01_27698 [Folsomia candida]
MPNSGDDQVIGRFLVLITLLLWSFPPGMILALYFVPMDPITHLYRIYFKSALRSGAAYVSYNMIRFMAIPVVYEACRIYTICVIVPVLFITRYGLIFSKNLILPLSRGESDPFDPKKLIGFSPWVICIMRQTDLYCLDPFSLTEMDKVVA